jgi:hypothetical protein
MARGVAGESQVTQLESSSSISGDGQPTFLPWTHRVGHFTRAPQRPCLSAATVRSFGIMCGGGGAGRRGVGVHRHGKAWPFIPFHCHCIGSARRSPRHIGIHASTSSLHTSHFSLLSSSSLTAHRTPHTTPHTVPGSLQPPPTPSNSYPTTHPRRAWLASHHVHPRAYLVPFSRACAWPLSTSATGGPRLPLCRTGSGTSSPSSVSHSDVPTPVEPAWNPADNR